MVAILGQQEVPEFWWEMNENRARAVTL